MQDKLAWGILGTGNIAKTFARGVNESDLGRLVAVGSRTQESAETFGNEFKVPHRYGSYEALLADPEVQCVYISTPHPMHAEWAIKCAEAGKGILCEKPVTLNYPDAMAVIEAVRRHDVFFMEAFMYRCHPQTARLVELIRDGAIGEVRLIHATFSFHGGNDPTSRLLNPELGGGGILDVGCYCTSMARLVAGAALGQDFAEPLEVQGMAHLGATGVDEWALATLRFPNDILAQLATGVQVNQESVVRIFGSKGSILVPSPWFCAREAGSSTIIVARHGLEVEAIEVVSEASLYAIEADTVAAHFEKKEAPSPAMSPDDSLGNMMTLDRWRVAAGLIYPEERADAVRPTLHRRPLAARPAHNMSYGQVAGLEKPVSRLVVGTMLEGAVLPLPHASALFDDFIEHGGNCFDTAFIYGGGRAEGIVGQWIKNRGCREQVVLIGKGAHTPHCNPADLTTQLVQSLDRLQTDYVDLYMMHRDNPDIPVGEFVDVLNEHLQAGRMRAFGGSNWSIERVAAANVYAREKGLTGFAAVSNNFSLARMVEPVWDGCLSNSDAASRAWFTQTQMPLFAWSSQARGFFVRGDKNFTADAELVRCWYSDDNFERLERVRQMAAERGVTPLNIALAYVLDQPFPAFALIGPRAISETRTSLPGLDIQLSASELRWLNLED